MPAASVAPRTAAAARAVAIVAGARACGLALEPALEFESVTGKGVIGTMFVAIDGRLAGLLGAADPLKASAAEALRQRHEEACAS